MNERSGNAAEQPPRPVTVRDRRRVHVEGAPPASGPAEQGGAGPQPGDGPPQSAGAIAAQPDEAQAEALAAAQAEAAGYLDDLQRLKAEFDNYRKRVVKEQSSLLERAAASLVLRLLPVLDNFELAVASAEDSRDFERMLKGIEMVFGELKEVLSSEGLTRIPARGQSFDPNYHEAALEVAGDDEGEPYVADELRSGYTFKGRVLRPSMVKVARRGKAEDPTR
jgi:molecular chaperone GrpE